MNIEALYMSTEYQLNYGNLPLLKTNMRFKLRLDKELLGK